MKGPHPTYRTSPSNAKKSRSSWAKMAQRRRRRGHHSGKHDRPGWLEQAARGAKGYS